MRWLPFEWTALVRQPARRDDTGIPLRSRRESCSELFVKSLEAVRPPEPVPVPSTVCHS